MANKVYRALETRVTFEPSGGTEPLTLTSLGAGAGRISDRYDRGAGSIAAWYSAILRTQFDTTPVAGEVLRIYLVEGWEFRDGGSNTVDEGGDLPNSDSAISDEDRFLSGGVLLGQLIVPPSPAATTSYVSLPMLFYTAARYLSFGVWNATADALEATASAHELALYPVPPEIQ